MSVGSRFSPKLPQRMSANYKGHDPIGAAMGESSKQYAPDDENSPENSALKSEFVLQSRYNPARAPNIREELIEKQMKSREGEYTENRPLRILTASWNVNGKKPGENISEWVDTSAAADIYAVGFQEFVELTAQAMVVTDTARIKEWDDAINETLNKGEHNYLPVMSKMLVGLMLIVYVKDELVPHIKQLYSDSVGVGIMNMMGNKGAVSIRFQVFDSTVCFVNTHLDADKYYVERRNQDYKDIIRRLTFGHDSSINLFDHDKIVWLGDLNYRMNSDYDDVRAKIAKQDWKALAGLDQLTVQRRKGFAFTEFTEAPLEFAPTYKYEPGTHEYESKGEKKRVPAWCDRVLWRGENIVPLRYRRHELITSDHKPVSCLLATEVKYIVKEKQQETYKSIVRMFDSWENENMPKITIDRNLVKFENVRYGTDSTQVVVLENTGQVKVQWRFIPLLEETSICQPWLSVNPRQGVVNAGEKIQIFITMSVEDASARRLQLGEISLEQILILHLENGRDYFITIGGDYLRSCFAVDLETLMRYMEPVRDAQPSSTHAKSIPSELWRMIDYLFNHAMQEPGLFTKSGVPEEMGKIRECLDVGDDFPSVNVHSMADTLIRFLQALPEPVIPFDLYDTCIAQAHSKRLVEELVSHCLAPAHYNVFVYVTAFLREVLSMSDFNRLTADRLGKYLDARVCRSVWAGNLETTREMTCDMLFGSSCLTMTLFCVQLTSLPA
eukprot:GFYU01011378.1.p1 GENE.GFYU01011378.1~~GFYU01011378.1.p1  ORF type:complete len:727 (-),score=210.50 GFYU01011378.1:188-2368(-)